VSGGNVIDFGGASVVEWGVCWNTSGNPEINDERAYAAGETDSFTCNISELIPGKYYYVRAYATNEDGFTALPAGIRTVSGCFQEMKSIARWWKSTEGEVREVSYETSEVKTDVRCVYRRGLSVRCINDP